MTTFVLFFAVALLAQLLGHRRGYKRGQRDERERVTGIMYTQLRRRLSPTLRNVLRAVESGAPELPEEEGE